MNSLLDKLKADVGITEEPPKNYVLVAKIKELESLINKQKSEISQLKRENENLNDVVKEQHNDMKRYIMLDELKTKAIEDDKLIVEKQNSNGHIYCVDLPNTKNSNVWKDPNDTNVKIGGIIFKLGDIAKRKKLRELVIQSATMTNSPTVGMTPNKSIFIRVGDKFSSQLSMLLKEFRMIDQQTSEHPTLGKYRFPKNIRHFIIDNS